VRRETDPALLNQSHTRQAVNHRWLALIVHVATVDFGAITNNWLIAGDAFDISDGSPHNLWQFGHIF
jgi:hypothetical protein